MGFIGSFLMLALVGWLVFGIGRRVLRCTGRLIPFTLLGIASVAAGVALFGTDDDEGYRHLHVGRWDISGNLDLDDADSPANGALGKFHSFLEDPEDFAFEFQHKRASFPKWVLIALGSILIISGTVLASREKTRPVAFKVLTVLGMAAGCFMLVSFFSSPPQHSSPRHVASRDRITRAAPEMVKEIQQKAREKAEEIRERFSGNSHAKKPSTKTTMRAKRPTMRPQKTDPADLAAELPPRAGEIPVAAELAKTEVKAPEAAATPAPAATPVVEAPPAPATTPESQTPVQEPAPVPEAPQAAPIEVKAPEAAAPAAPSPPQPETAPAAAEPAATPNALPEAPAETSQPVEAAPTASEANAPPVVAPAVQQPAAEAAPSPPVATPPVAIQLESQNVIAKAATQPGAEIAPPMPAANRPDWVETSGRLEGAVYRTSVKSGLYVDVPECQRALDLAIRKQANHYVDDYLGPGASGTIDLPLGYLRKHLVKAEFGEIVQSESVGPMQQIHALLEFDDDARADFHRRWRDALVTNRLWYAGSATALVLAMLGTFYSYLTLDLRTGGAHKGQLRLAATLVALIVVAGALLVRRAVPF